MKKKATVLIASIMAFCGINTAHADEGMWTIYNLPNAVYEMMQREGFSMTYDQLYNGENALKNAVVNFSGYCSGVVVSPDGLVFTNHHCGFEAIRSHSTVPIPSRFTFLKLKLVMSRCSLSLSDFERLYPIISEPMS